uniref:Uncharacterized mitochondrial protein AtMg00810-like n=1 Tax=Tanacetum cinerariifolium TaxID=118510 RepID=A0A6L2KWA3_TANCI|nr:uncharacterized mitochondrial protein AtMg00810-like [Tanacetum cinerariifolium]
MCDEFAKIMHDEFEMSMMGKLLPWIKIKQMKDDIFFNQSTYIKEMLKKFGLEDSKPMKTLMSSDTKLTKDKECESVDSTKYQGMIGSLLYLMASRPDIMFSFCLCARFQEAPKTSYLEAVKRIFRYIKGTMHLGLWYPKGTGIETVVYADSNHAGDYVDRKSTSVLMSSSNKSPRDYSLKHKRVILVPLRQSHNLPSSPPSPPLIRTPPTSPIIINPLLSSLPPLSPSNILPKSPLNSPIFDATHLPSSLNSSNPTSSLLPP